MSALEFDPFEGDFGEPGDRTMKDAMVKARKPHTCAHCCGPIGIGETHRARTDVIAGDIMSWRWCALCCTAMVEQMNGDDDDERYPYEARTKLNEKVGTP